MKRPGSSMTRGRGGARQGTPGTLYENRSDLRSPKPPIQRFQGQVQGTQAAQVDQQQAANSLVSAAAPPSTAETMPYVPMPVPTPIDAPTERPDEPMTAGLPFGPGPGPEALGIPQAGSVERLRPMLPVLELIASSGNADAETVNFVRRLRGALGAG